LSTLRHYTIQPNDTLFGIAQRQLGRAERWTELAKLNSIRDSHHLLIGQVIFLPPNSKAQLPPTLGPVSIAATQSNGNTPGHQRPATIVPARAFTFVLADEFNPLTRKVVRRVLMPPKGVTDPALLERIMNPERHGFSPRAPGGPVSMGRHVGGRTDSGFISASDRPLGSPRFEGERFWIDVAKAEQSGVKVHETSEIIADLDRVIAKTKSAVQRDKFAKIREAAVNVDREILLEGHVPAGAVKGATSMALTRGAQVVTGVGIILTAYDLEQAGERSVKQGSVKPLAAESVRQAGGWAGAWAGAEIGGMAGAAVGIETGPGAVVTGLVGGLIGGIAGFMGADWIGHKIEAN
jgi:murein DD-endopeptidase MepM/ murein hydrolase activator NlpD